MAVVVEVAGDEAGQGASKGSGLGHDSAADIQETVTPPVPLTTARSSMPFPMKVAGHHGNSVRDSFQQKAGKSARTVIQE